MNTLRELNTYSDTLLPYTDLRTAKIVFDRLAGTAQAISFSTGDQHTLPIGLNISEIVLPDEEDVYFQVDVNASPGASAIFPTLPSGYTAVEVSTQVYRVSNIQSVADWNLIKNVVINIASNFKTNWNYTATIGYENGLTKSWTVAATWTTYTQMAAAFNSAASFTAAIGKRSRSAVALSSRFNISTRIVEYRLQSSSNLIVSADRRKGITAQLAAKVTMIAAGQGVISNHIPRTYVGKTANNIFAVDTPQITHVSANPNTDTYQFRMQPYRLFGISGYLSLDGGETMTADLRITGTKAFINSKISSITYWTEFGNESEADSYIILISLNGSSIYSRQVSYTYTGSATIVPTTLTFNSNGTFTPTIIQRLYCPNFDILLVGGGGGGGYGLNVTGRAGGGGGGAGVYNFNTSMGTNFTTKQVARTYNITVGTGGATNITTTTGSTAFAGGLSRITQSNNSNFVLTATGGTGGGQGSAGISGGTASGPNATPSTGIAAGNPGTGTGYQGGGGGGGASGTGSNGGIFSGVLKGGNGGLGIANSISGSNITYGYGGGGGVSWDGRSDLANGTAGTSYTTPGSGGSGGPGRTTGAPLQPTSGRNGIVIIKVY